MSKGILIPERRKGETDVCVTVFSLGGRGTRQREMERSRYKKKSRCGGERWPR